MEKLCGNCKDVMSEGGVLFLEFSSQNLISTTIAHFIFLVFDGLVIL